MAPPLPLPGVPERAGFAPDIVCSTDDNLALQSLVAAGLGVTLVPRLVSSFVRHPRVVAMPVTPALWRHVAGRPSTPDELATTLLERIDTGVLLPGQSQWGSAHLM